MPKGMIAAIVGVVIVIVIAAGVWKVQQMMAVECEVCINYNGRTNCATAAGADAREAARAAQTTACAPIAGGMSDSIACDRAQPEKRVCTDR